MTSDEELRRVFSATERNGCRPAPEFEPVILRNDGATDVLLPKTREGFRVSHLVAIRRAGEDARLPEDEIEARVRRAVVALAMTTMAPQARFVDSRRFTRT